MLVCGVVSSFFFFCVCSVGGGVFFLFCCLVFTFSYFSSPTFFLSRSGSIPPQLTMQDFPGISRLLWP